MSDEVKAPSSEDTEDINPTVQAGIAPGEEEVTAHFAEDIDEDSPCWTNNCGTHSQV